MTDEGGPGRQDAERSPRSRLLAELVRLRSKSTGAERLELETRIREALDNRPREVLDRLAEKYLPGGNDLCVTPVRPNEMSTPPELNATERHILKSLCDEANEAEEDGESVPVLDYWEGENDWAAAKRLVELGLVRVDTEDTTDGQGHLVLRESYKGTELLEAVES